MNNITCINMPLKPRENIVGLKVGPIVTETISKMLESKSLFTFNILHSFTELDQTFNKYIEELSKWNVNADKITTDKTFKEAALKNIEKLYNKGIVRIVEEDLVCCPCGKVNVLKSDLIKIKNFKIVNIREDGFYYCKDCGNKCKEINSKVLILDIGKINLNKIQIFPNVLSKETNDLLESLKNSQKVISKTRETGIKFTIDGQMFNIDIDAIWSQFLCFANDSNLIAVGSNHVLGAMVLSYIMERAICGKKETIFVATPYLQVVDDELFDKLGDDISKKLAIMYSCKWNSKNSYISSELLRTLRKNSTIKNKQLYKIMCEFSDSERNIRQKDEGLYHYVERLLKYGTNFQKNLKFYKEKCKNKELFD